MKFYTTEYDRSPEFMKEMAETAQRIQELRDKVLRREITLDEAATEIASNPRYHRGFADVRSMIARGQPRELCVQAEDKSGK